MLRVKALLPSADAAELCARKPALFTLEGVERAEVVAAAVRRGLAPASSSSTSPCDADALLAAVPEVLVADTDAAVSGVVARAAALQRILPGADVPKMCGKRPELLVTSDAGAAASKVGHAAGAGGRLSINTTTFTSLNSSVLWG